MLYKLISFFEDIQNQQKTNKYDQKNATVHARIQKVLSEGSKSTLITFF